LEEDLLQDIFRIILVPYPPPDEIKEAFPLGPDGTVNITWRFYGDPGLQRLCLPLKSKTNETAEYCMDEQHGIDRERSPLGGEFRFQNSEIDREIP
jgi:hypothetical protein